MAWARTMLFIFSLALATFRCDALRPETEVEPKHTVHMSVSPRHFQLSASNGQIQTGSARLDADAASSINMTLSLLTDAASSVNSTQMSHLEAIVNSAEASNASGKVVPLDMDVIQGGISDVLPKWRSDKRSST